MDTEHFFREPLCKNNMMSLSTEYHTILWYHDEEWKMEDKYDCCTCKWGIRAVVAFFVGPPMLIGIGCARCFCVDNGNGDEHHKWKLYSDNLTKWTASNPICCCLMALAGCGGRE
jgi:hypothetical protein